MLGIKLGTNFGIHWRKHTARLLAILVAVSLGLALAGCAKQGGPTLPGIAKSANQLSEVSPPKIILDLRKDLETYQPQVSILSPRPDEVLQDTTVAVRLQVNDLPLFKNEEWGLGPHLHFILDNQPYEAIYDVSEPIVLQDLAPGTHTIRVFASRPWHESFKNVGAYAQATFHIFTKTPENNPDPDQPLLTYSRPKGSYGAEPIMLDFYLTNAPLHMVAQEDREDEVLDWIIRCTINGESFTFDRWEPIYLKGFKPGRNWVQLELLDENGNPYPNAFNNTVRLITYEPGGSDTLSKLKRGELSIADVRGIVIPGYVPPAPEPEPEPEVPVSEPEAAEPAPTEPEVTEPEVTIEPAPEPTPEPTPEIVPGEPAVEFVPVEPEESPIEQPGEIKEQLTEERSTEAPKLPETSEAPGVEGINPAQLPAQVPIDRATQASKAEEQLKREVEEFQKEIEEELEKLETPPLEEEMFLPPVEPTRQPQQPIVPAKPLANPATDQSPSPLEPTPPQDKKLLNRAKNFLNRVIPRPTEPTPSPVPLPMESPGLDTPGTGLAPEQAEFSAPQDNIPAFPTSSEDLEPLDALDPQFDPQADLPDAAKSPAPDRDPSREEVHPGNTSQEPATSDLNSPEGPRVYRPPISL